jgi:hypothetical protein
MAGFSDAISYGSRLLKTAWCYNNPHSVWDHAYCMPEQKHRCHSWKKQIDKGHVDRRLHYAMVMSGKVIVLTRDEANHTQLSAFKIEDASPAWTSAINDSLSFNLIFAGRKFIPGVTGTSIATAPPTLLKLANRPAAASFKMLTRFGRRTTYDGKI